MITGCCSTICFAAPPAPCTGTRASWASGALHTYGHQLNKHPHIHISITRGGLDIGRDLFCKKQQVEAI
uniref:transposase n=1 Tax=Enterobacter huaxiensis TaxID=2494702 RepID=UPI002952B5C9|nr:transposase [Enterobacter huaxiensis]